MNTKMTECDRLFQNMIDIKNITMEQAVKEIKREAEYENEKIQVVLQFPESTDKASQAKEEVTEILNKELQKQMRKKGVVYYEKSTDIIKG